MTETRINPGDMPYGAAYSLPAYPPPPYGDPLVPDPLTSPYRDRDGWGAAGGAPPATGAWGGSGPYPGDGAQQATGWDQGHGAAWVTGQGPGWGQAASQLAGMPGTSQPTPGSTPYGNPISPPYGVPPQGGGSGAYQQSPAYPQAQYPSGGYPVAPSGQYPAPQYPYPTQPGTHGGPGTHDGGAASGHASGSGAYPLSGQHPAAQYQAPAPDQAGQYPQEPSQGTMPGGYTTPSGQHPAPYQGTSLSGQYQAPPWAAAPPTGAGTGAYPAAPEPYTAPSGQYPAQSGQYPAQSGQYPAQSGQHPAQSGQYPALQPDGGLAASGQYPLPAWAGSSSLVPVTGAQDGPGSTTGQHERVKRGKSARLDQRIETARIAADEDAKFLSALKSILSLPSLFPRMVFVVLGFTAIGPLALAYIEALPLSVSARFILLPAAIIVITLGLRYREWGRRALIGWGAGIIATIVYDCLRLALVQVGIWGDPIPGIGRLLLNDPDANWAWGYAWRFMGNGGGMAIAFTMLPWRGVKAGIIYGTLICIGLIIVLAFWPVAQSHFFPLTPLTAAGGMAGHWVYGAVLGWITGHFLPPVERDRPAEAPTAGYQAAGATV